MVIRQLPGGGAPHNIIEFRGFGSGPGLAADVTEAGILLHTSDGGTVLLAGQRDLYSVDFVFT